MRDCKPSGSLLWAVLLVVAAIFSFNGCGNVNDVFVPNDPPVANAGADLGSIPPGTKITLNGSSSTDPDGNPLTYSWKLLSKPASSPAVLANPTSATPTFTVDRAGDYTAQLIVNDGTVSSAPDTVLISTGNVPPVADAGPDQGGVGPGSVTLDGSGSSDANGDPLTYSWSLLSTPAGSGAVLVNPTSVMPTFTVDRAGDYIAQLIVNDGTVDSAPNTVTITTSNVPPVADAGPDQGGVGPGSVTLDGSGSSDANGDLLTYSWSLLDRPTGSGAVLVNPTSVMPTFTVDRDGDYVAQLIVRDGTVNSAPDTVRITSNNVAPVARAGPDQGGKIRGSVIILDGSASSDANGDPITYSWTFTSRPGGSTAVLADATSVSPRFTIDQDGDYVVKLIVNDGTENSAPDSVRITSNNVAPVARAGPDQGGKIRGSVIILDGSASSDANGDPITYSWTFTSRPGGSTAVLTDATSVSPRFIIDQDGDYVVKLIVNDGTENSAPDSVRITSNNVAPVANAGPDQPDIARNTLIILDGSASSDANGDPITYSWTFTSRPGGSTAVLADATSVSPTFTADLVGDYVVKLIVNDGTENSAPDSVRITSKNVAPVANAGQAQTVAVNTLVILDGSASSDANGDSLTYSWSLLSTPDPQSIAVLANPTSVSPTFTVDFAGDYVVQLIVNDGTVDSAPKTVTITAN